jgi:hypothetical protein
MMVVWLAFAVVYDSCMYGESILPLYRPVQF